MHFSSIVVKMLNEGDDLVSSSSLHIQPGNEDKNYL